MSIFVYVCIYLYTLFYPCDVEHNHKEDRSMPTPRPQNDRCLPRTPRNAIIVGTAKRQQQERMPVPPTLAQPAPALPPVKCILRCGRACGCDALSCPP